MELQSWGRACLPSRALTGCGACSGRRAFWPCVSGSCAVSHRKARHSPPDSWHPRSFPNAPSLHGQAPLAVPPRPKEEEDTVELLGISLPVGSQLLTTHPAWHSPRLSIPEQILKTRWNGPGHPTCRQQGPGSVLRLHHGDHPAWARAGWEVHSLRSYTRLFQRRVPPPPRGKDCHTT